jgi:WD40 repeat protein
VLVRIWDAETGLENMKLEGLENGAVMSISTSLDGRVIVSGSEDGTLQ